MSAKKRSTSGLKELVREAKDARVPEVDWSKVEAKLFPRVEHEAKAQAALASYAGRKRAWVGAAVAIALAAAVPLLITRTPESSLDQVAADERTPSAGSLAWKDSSAIARITHATIARDAPQGDAVANGDTVDVRGGHAVFERTEPTGVTWSLEDGAHVEVRATRGTLVVALGHGAIEAQVAPVTNGEAFAVDVEGARVAVHGTHLRVAREGARAIVDLREGVISIGLPPRTGATYGDLVMAPAHVEFDSADPHGTLKVTHDEARVRAADSLARPADPSHPAPPRAVLPIASPPSPAPLPAGTARPAAPITPPATPLATPATTPTSTTTAPAAVPSPQPPVIPPARADANPERTIREAIRTCAQQRIVPANGVVVTVRTRLELRVSDLGAVESARFDPPLDKEVQDCAARVIYGTRFSTPGAVSVSVDVTP